MLRRVLGEKVPGEDYTWGQAVVTSLLKQAQDGDVVAIKTVLERIDGKVLDQVDVTTGGTAFTFTIQGVGIHPEQDEER
jgi:hypothetical protein